ncbi:MAG: hypothetical protein KKD31_14670 [Bacteroidetes bacterium]|nr:hypothetical protein [Bacteroidota bacterium]
MKTRYIYHYQIAQASPLGEVGEVVVQAPDATQGLNRYSYALGNPLAFTDPSGYEVTGGSISNQPHLQELNHQRSMERYNWLESFVNNFFLPHTPEYQRNMPAAKSNSHSISGFVIPIFKKSLYCVVKQTGSVR